VSGFTITTKPARQYSENVRKLMLEKLGKELPKFEGMVSFEAAKVGEVEIVGAFCPSCRKTGPLSEFLEVDTCICGSQRMPSYCEKFKTVVCADCSDMHYCVGCSFTDCPLRKDGEEAPFVEPISFDDFIHNFGRE